MKKLFLVVGDGGDGSYNIKYTFNEDFINACDKAYDEGKLDESFPGCDGDGFHYDTLFIPDNLSLKDLGISYDFAENWDIPE